jgi:hypothetical protein
MTMTNTIFAIATLFAVSCSSTTKTMKNESDNTLSVNAPDDKKMMEAGYTKGTIVFSDEAGDCPYTIKVGTKDQVMFFDPINLEQEFKADATAVWFKYGQLKMMNRCDKANPISITEIQKVK